MPKKYIEHPTFIIQNVYKVQVMKLWKIVDNEKDMGDEEDVHQVEEKGVHISIEHHD